MPTAYVDGRDRDKTRDALVDLARIAERCAAAGHTGEVTLFVDELHRVAADPELGKLIQQIAVTGRKVGVHIEDAPQRFRRQYQTLAEFEAAA